MKKPIILYIIITIICVIALIMGIYYQFFKQDTQDVGTQGNILPDKNGEETELTQEELKAEFSELFTNKLDKKGFNTENIEKIDPTRNKYFLYVGRISKEKGVDLFCKAITRLGYEGIVVGDGDERKRLEKEYPNIKFTVWKNKN